MKSHLEFLKELIKDHVKREWKERGKIGKFFFVWNIGFVFVYFPVVIGLQVLTNTPVSKFNLIFWMGFAWMMVLFNLFKDVMYEWEVSRYRNKTDEIIFGAVKGILSEIVKRSGANIEVNVEKGEDKKPNEKFN